MNLKLRYTIEWNASYGVAGSPEQIAKCDALKANVSARHFLYLIMWNFLYIQV